jgi:multidrug resistance efflux pump
MQQPDPKLRGFSTFLQLERAARHAESVDALAYVAVNETRRLLNYRQAVLAAGGDGTRPRVRAVSGVSVLERDAPFVRWHEKTLAALAQGAAAREVRRLEAEALPADLQAGWSEFQIGHALYVPLIAPDGEMLGALWLTRQTAWSESDAVLAERLADCYAHAWRALAGRRAGRRKRRWPKIAAGTAAVALLAALAIPVPQSALAPAEVVAADPRVVAAPMDGVIARVHVQPNQAVAAGETLFTFDATELESQAAVARRALAIAEAELRRASQGAFADREETAKLQVLETKRDLRAAELAQAEERLSRVTVTAEQAGVAIFTDANDWVGRPVRTGERVMQVADPDDTRLRIDLPVADAVQLEPGARVALFLDVAPLGRVPATLTRASYEATTTPDEVLAYRVYADFADGAAPRRPGLKGTAKLFGPDVPLALYLFRRPVSAVRQWLGL